MKFKKFYYKKVNSTNDTALKHISKGLERGIIIADYQNKGKGQRGKNWISFKGNLFMSLFFQIEKKLSLKKITKLNALIIKECLKIAGIENQNYSGHSLRSGFATVAAESGADERSIMAMTGHKTSQMVRRYIQEANLFKNNALKKIKI